MQIIKAGYEILDELKGSEILKEIKSLIPVVFDDLEPLEA